MKKPLSLFAVMLSTAASAQVEVFLPAQEVSTRMGRSVGGGMTLEVENPGNHTWQLRSWTGTGEWTNHSVYKVPNGRLSIPIDPVGPTRFYQLVSVDSPPASTVAGALELPVTPFNYANPTLPAHLTTPQILGQINTPGNNAITNAGATLGRVLFYDKRMSANQTVSCSSCHQAEHGFSDPARFSTGFDGGLTGRNSMGLTNARYYLRQNFFWDERAATLEDQVLQPIQDHIEMGITLDVMVSRIQAEGFYGQLFTAAFGSSQVTTTRVSRALSQFVRSIISSNSKYDQGVPVGFSNFTASESRGRNIFNGGAGGCAQCHGSDNFVPGNAIFNNGLENPYTDKGLGEVTGAPADEGFFKVPSLRNIALTAPYMHDGRFATLEQVVEFYNSGVVAHPNLSPQLRLPPGPPGSPPPGPRRLNLTNQQKADLVAFMRTLTDLSVTTDEKFLDPFRYEAP